MRKKISKICRWISHPSEDIFERLIRKAVEVFEVLSVVMTSSSEVAWSKKAQSILIFLLRRKDALPSSPFEKLTILRYVRQI